MTYREIEYIDWSPCMCWCGCGGGIRGATGFRDEEHRERMMGRLLEATFRRPFPVFSLRWHPQARETSISTYSPGVIARLVFDSVDYDEFVQRRQERARERSRERRSLGRTGP